MACAPPSSPTSPRTSAGAEPRHGSAHHQPVVITLVIDQFAAWEALERLPQLSASGGFARLRREGTWLVEARYPYAVTETAPGHATLYTGVVPAQSGIYSNEVWADGKAVGILNDPSTRLITDEHAPAATTAAATSASLDRLRVPTIADQLRAASPNARIVSLSIKDRGALFGGGRHPTTSLWYDTNVDGMVTSSAVGTEIPRWVQPIAGHQAIARARHVAWTPLDRPLLEQRAATDDDQAGEGNFDGLGTTFPHSIARAQHPPQAFRVGPWSDELLLNLALRAVTALRAPAQPMLLAVSLSAHDYVGHVFGPDGWEAWDELVRLDAALARFMRGLDSRLGSDGWSLVLTGDHGSPPLPESAPNFRARPWCRDREPHDRFERPCTVGVRVQAAQVAAALEAAAVAAVGSPPVDSSSSPAAARWIAGVADPIVYLSSAAQALPAAKRTQLQRALAAAVPKIAGLAAGYVIDELPSPCPPLSDESITALVCRSVPPGAGALYLVTTPGSFFEIDYVTGHGIHHGSPRLYDRTVPILARGVGIEASRVIDRPVQAATTAACGGVESTLTFTRTVADLLGVSQGGSWPPADDPCSGRSLAMMTPRQP